MVGNQPYGPCSILQSSKFFLKVLMILKLEAKKACLSLSSSESTSGRLPCPLLNQTSNLYFGPCFLPIARVKPQGHHPHFQLPFIRDIGLSLGKVVHKGRNFRPLFISRINFSLFLMLMDL